MGVKERVEGEVVGMEVGVVLPEDVTEGLIVGTFTYDMMPCVRATLPPSTLFADRALLCRGYSISEPNT